MGGKKLDPMSKEFFYGTFGNDIFNKTKGLYSGVSGQNV